MKKGKIEIGQKVFVINKDLTIEEKEVFAIIDMGDEVGYTLDKNSCGGYSEYTVFTTKSKAEVEKQNFLDGLRFKIGELLVFKVKEYSRKEIVIGRVYAIKYDSNEPYEIRTQSKNIHNISDDDVVLKVKNEFIENFGDMKELYKKFEEKRRELDSIYREIEKEHEQLEKELGTSFKKQFPWWSHKRKPIFSDRFNYEEEDYY